MQDHFEFKDCTLLYELSGVNSTVEFWSDLPNGTFAQRQASVLTPTSTGRYEKTIPLDGLFGRVHQHRIIAPSGATFALYAGSMRYRRIGTYLDGNGPDIWRTHATALGVPERVKLFRQLALDCIITGGNVVVNISTDLPGSALALRRTQTLGATSGRRTIKIRIPQTAKGYHVEMYLAPASGVTMVLFEAKIEAKVLGEAEPRGWGWQSLYAERSNEPWETDRWPIPGFDPVPRWVPIPVDAIE